MGGHPPGEFASQRGSDQGEEYFEDCSSTREPSFKALKARQEPLFYEGSLPVLEVLLVGAFAVWAARVKASTSIRGPIALGAFCFRVPSFLVGLSGVAPWGSGR